MVGGVVSLLQAAAQVVARRACCCIAGRQGWSSVWREEAADRPPNRLVEVGGVHHGSYVELPAEGAALYSGGEDSFFGGS